MSTAEKDILILIVEASSVIRHGLTRILSDYFTGCSIENLHAFRALEQFPEKKESALIIINTEMIAGILPAASDALAAFQNAKRIGLIANYNKREHISLFDDIIYLSDSEKTIAGIVRKHLRTPAGKKKQQEKLTNRELDVLKLLIKGYSTKQIAGELFISAHTVVTHRKNIAAKLGIKSIAGLAVYGVINNMIDVDDYLDHIQEFPEDNL